MLQEVANVDCSYNLTPEQLYEKVAVSDALIVRSATKVRPVANRLHVELDLLLRRAQVMINEPWALRCRP
jgi:D-3-phosphoglycerate dehydrogenase